MTQASSGEGDAAIPQDVHRRALAWQVTFWSGEVTSAEQAAFRRWLAADPLHERAWRDVQRVDAMLGRVPATVGGRLLRLPGTRPGRRAVLRTLGWLAAGGALALAVRETPQWHAAVADHATGIGERRDVVLGDGTRVSLNSASAFDVRFDARQRAIVLHAGELLIDTAPDAAARPFHVQTRDGSLRPVGTRFSVRLEAQASHVAVYEGAVEIHPRDASAMRRLDAGHQARFDAVSIDADRPADALETAWTRGLLVAERMALGDFLERLGRHRPGVLRCEPGAARLLISGVYPLDDTDRVLAALAEALPVRIDYATRYWVTVRAR